MTIRSIRYELEAKLTGPRTGFFSRPSGKVERKSYGDGGERLKIKLRDIKAPEGSLAVVSVGGEEITQVPLSQGRGRLDTETQDASALPALEIGHDVVVVVGGEEVLRGALYRDQRSPPHARGRGTR